MIYYIYITESGLPKTGLYPTWYSLQEGNLAGTDKIADAPLIEEVGGNENGNGWYYFDITYGVTPWNTTTVNLVGVIDSDPNPSGTTLADVERYIPIIITLRSLGLARIAHKGVQNKTTGDIIIYKADGATAEMKLDMTEDGNNITRNPTVA